MVHNKVQNKVDACGIICVLFVYIALVYSNYAFLAYVIFYVDYRFVDDELRRSLQSDSKASR